MNYQSLIGFTTFLGFVALPATAQPINVPFIGRGNVTINTTTGNLTGTNNTALTPFGTVVFGGSTNGRFINNTTGFDSKTPPTSPLIKPIKPNSINEIVFTGNTTGTFDETSRTFDVPAPTTILGSTTNTISDPNPATVIISKLTGGIKLPSTVLGIQPRTFAIPIAINGGTVNLSSNFSVFEAISIKFTEVLTSLGIVKIDSANFTSLNLIKDLGLDIAPGTYSPFEKPTGTDEQIRKLLIGQRIGISGISSGTLDYPFTVGSIQTNNIVNLDNAVFDIQGITRLPVVKNGDIQGILIDISSGSKFFVPENLIKDAQAKAIQNVGNKNPIPEVSPRLKIISRIIPPQIQVDPISIGSIAGAFTSIESSRNSLFGSSARILSVEDSLKEIARVSEISNSPTAVVYPEVRQDRLEILMLHNGKTFRTAVALPQEALTEIVLRFRDNLQDASSSAYLVESKLLYNLLIRPLEDELKSGEITTIVFALDGDLRSVPVSALNDGNQFLIEKYALSTVPSLSLANTNRTTSVRNKKSNILAVGLTEAVQGFSALPNVQTEVSTIGSKILAGTSLFDQDFTVENVQAQRIKGKFNIIHLATHAEFDEENSDSFVLFWDKKVRSSQLPKLRLENLDLLTLSACQTAVGNNLGLSGLAVASGVKSVLASLWSVDDAGTAPLMMSFYTNYNDAPSKAIALQKAQISLLNGTVKIENKTIKGIPAIGDIPLAGVGDNIDLKHPYYWSSFILVGNWL